jgi:formylglycine-generating enzyme required for sulfatase activity
MCLLVICPVFGQQPKEITNSIGMKLVVIPAGTFIMGSPEDEVGRQGLETQHEVTISRPYCLGIYEVTQDEYATVMGTNPSSFRGVRNPVENISWDEAVSFCKKLSEMPEEKAARREYRLPTEAEWEYACRAGSDAAYSFGDSTDPLDEHAWFGEQSKGTHPVGEKKPNRWGLYDMHGNVWEWCEDWLGSYPSGAAIDPHGPAQGQVRAFRGGSWDFGAAYCRSASRLAISPSFRTSFYGLRVAFSATEAEQVVVSATAPGTWHLTYRRATETTAPHLEQPRVLSENVTLLIGSQSYELQEPETTHLYATENKMLTTLYHRTKEHLKMPMHALVWFLHSETTNRVALCRGEEAANLSTAETGPCSRFELESLLSYSHPHATQLFDEKKLEIQHTYVDGTHRYAHDGKEFVAYRPSSHEVGPEHREMLRRFIAHQCDIHPEIRKDIVTRGHLPTQMSFRSREGTEETMVTYKIEGALFNAKEHVVEIPLDYVPQSKDSRLEMTLNRLESTQIPTVDELLKESGEAIDKSVMSHRIEEAVLIAYRFFEVFDNDKGFRDLLQRCGGLGDRRVRRAAYGLNDLREIKEAKQKLESTQSKMAYLLNFYYADIAMDEHRMDEPIKESLLACLESDPLVVGAYVDLWRVYLTDWDPYSAWRCVNAARKIAPDHGYLLPLKNMEKNMEFDSPDFF